MFFRDVIGQEEVKQRLIQEVNEGRIPHAQLICGPEGVGKIPLAIAYARYISCSNRSETDACGVCPSCVKFNKLVHPDVHFVFPIVNKAKSPKVSVCADFLPQWREQLLTSPYFNLNHWLNNIGAENKQAQIFANESDEILKKLSLKSSEGGFKITIVWLPEKLHPVCANKLLKLLEEPPERTIFLLVSEKPDMILPTIQSRTQRMNVRKIDEASIDREVQHSTCRQPFHRPSGKWKFYQGTRNDSSERRESTVLRFIRQPDAVVLSTENQGNENVERTGGRHGTRTPKEFSGILPTHDSGKLHL